MYYPADLFLLIKFIMLWANLPALLLLIFQNNLTKLQEIELS
jgi:hypothetical protein